MDIALLASVGEFRLLAHLILSQCRPDFGGVSILHVNSGSQQTTERLNEIIGVRVKCQSKSIVVMGNVP